jgi:undecaprenyl-phosphate galactose phosphotransferase
MSFRYKSIAQFLALALLDLCAYYVALTLSVFTETDLRYLFNFTYIFRKGLGDFVFIWGYLLSVWWIPMAYVFALFFEKLYHVRYPFWEESKIILKAVTIAIIFVFLTVAVRNLYGNLSRSFFLFLWLYLIFLLPLFRYWGKKFLYKIGLWKESVLIIGSGEKAIKTIAGLSKEEHLGYNVIGLLDDHYRKSSRALLINGKEYKFYGSIKNFDKFVGILKMETVFIASPEVSQEELTDLVNEIYKHVRRVIIVPDIKGVAIFNSELHYLFMEKLFMIKVNNNLNSTTNMIIKRIFDITVSFVGFVFALPFLLLIAGIIKFSSKGPVIFSHKRIGKNGKEFQAYKFRTMYKDAREKLDEILKSNPEAKKEWGRNFKLKNDPRVTPIGRILRNTSLDELPQIFNILKGEMSLVGPRPVVAEEIEKYYGTFKQYYYSVKPGLAGLWQVSGRSDTDYDFRIQTDVWYVQNWSVWLDIIILFKTVRVVLKREGAY